MASFLVISNLLCLSALKVVDCNPLQQSTGMCLVGPALNLTGDQSIQPSLKSDKRLGFGRL